MWITDKESNSTKILINIEKELKTGKKWGDNSTRNKEGKNYVFQIEWVWDEADAKRINETRRHWGKKGREVGWVNETEEKSKS